MESESTKLIEISNEYNLMDLVVSRNVVALRKVKPYINRIDVPVLDGWNLLHMCSFTYDLDVCINFMMLLYSLTISGYDYFFSRRVWCQYQRNLSRLLGGQGQSSEIDRCYFSLCTQFSSLTY